MITRADDLGCSHAANLAIAEVVTTGDIIKNVSCMAVGPHIEEGAELLKNCRAICLGMHATLNAEWDLIKWLPVTPTEKIPSLLTLEGTFAADPSQFLTKIPDTKQILVEFDNQLDLLTKFGLNIQYVDTHMLPEFFISGLHQAMDEWVKKKGLINHIPYYRFPSKLEPEKCNSFDASLAAMFRWLDSLKDDGYFSVMHPAKYSREMLLFTNSMNKGSDNMLAEVLTRAGEAAITTLPREARSILSGYSLWKRRPEKKTIKPKVRMLRNQPMR